MAKIVFAKQVFIYFQAVPVKKRRLQYDRGNLALAYDAALKGMSVCSAAKRYQVPESTLSSCVHVFYFCHDWTKYLQ